MEQYTPPPDYLTQIIPATIGITIAFLANIELLDSLRSRHVRLLLLPFCLLALAQCVLVLASLLLFYSDPDIAEVRRFLLTIVPIRACYNALDTFIYLQRTKSILIFYPRWKLGIIAFLSIKFAWQSILIVIDLIKIARATTAMALFRPDRLTTTQNLTNIIAPALQAILVDGSLLWVIMKTLREAGKDIKTSYKRLSRILLLIVASSTFLLLEVLFSSDAMRSLVASGTGNIVTTLAAFVNIDLYLLDLKLFVGPRSQTPSFEA